MILMKGQEKYNRTATVLSKKYIYYMFPAMLSAVGISLSEFADSMVVSNLLGSDAFAVINLSSPIPLITAMIYTISGSGGALLFSEYLGRKDTEKADRYFSVSSVLALISGIILFVLLLLFQSSVADVFGCPSALRQEFNTYMQILSLFVPFGIILMHFSFFLPVVGKPFLSVALVVSVNAFNLILDVVFIKVFGMGCEGASLATAVSYATGFCIMLIVWHFCKIPLNLRKFNKAWDISCIVKEIIKKGIPSGVVQAGYATTILFCNHFLNAAFGINGIVAMSLFSQMDSIISVPMSAIIDNNAPFTAMLKGEGDYYGIRNLSRRVAIMNVAVCTLFATFFAAFPTFISSIFNVHDPDALALIQKLINIYVIYYPLRCIVLVLRDIYNALDRNAYATFLGVVDKVASIPIIGGMMYLIAGGYGLVAAFPVSMLFILILIFVINRVIVRESNGRFSSVLLLDEEYKLKALCSYTVKSLEDASEIGQHIGKDMADSGVSTQIADRICLAAEEMAIYIVNQCGENSAVDFLISYNGGEYILVCRSSGTPFYPINENKMSPNELLLSGLFGIRHEYIFGLNSTNLTIKAQNLMKDLNFPHEYVG